MLPKPQHRLKIFADKNVTEIRGNLPGCFKRGYSEHFTELVAKHLQGIVFAAELQTSMQFTKMMTPPSMESCDFFRRTILLIHTANRYE